jgi:hypothetical protein
MSKVVKVVTIAFVLTFLLTLAVTGAASADDNDDSGIGPAPNYHDGIPDGPGWPEGTIPNGPNDEVGPGAKTLGPLESC